MAVRITPPFRADHVGSLLRPAELLAARADHAAGRIDADELRAAEDDAIRAAIKMQRDVGLRSATDGEFRRTSWHIDFIYALGGITEVEGEGIHVQFRNEAGEYDYAPPAMRVVRSDRAAEADLRRGVHVPARQRRRRHHAEADDPIAVDGPLPRRQLVDRPERLPGHRRLLGRSRQRLRGPGAGRLRPRVPLPPARRHEPRLRQRPGAARAHRKPSAAIPSTCTSSTSPTSTVRSPAVPTTWRSPRTCVAATTSRCGRPRAAMTSSPRRCSATWRSTATSSSSTTSAPVASSRCATCPRASRSCSVSSRPSARTLEDKDMLKRRIEEASKYIDIDQLCLSPQCGFSSSVEGNHVTHEDQAAKLRLVVETARGGLGRMTVLGQWRS